MLTQSDITRITDKTNGHWTLTPNNKDAVNDLILREVTETIRKKLKGMRPNGGISVEVFVAESK